MGYYVSAPMEAAYIAEAVRNIPAMMDYVDVVNVNGQFILITEDCDADDMEETAESDPSMQYSHTVSDAMGSFVKGIQAAVDEVLQNARKK